MSSNLRNGRDDTSLPDFGLCEVHHPILPYVESDLEGKELQGRPLFLSASRHIEGQDQPQGNIRDQESHDWRSIR